MALCRAKRARNLRANDHHAGAAAGSSRLSSVAHSASVWLGTNGGLSHCIRLLAKNSKDSSLAYQLSGRSPALRQMRLLKEAIRYRDVQKTKPASPGQAGLTENHLFVKTGTSSPRDYVYDKTIQATSGLHEPTLDDLPDAESRPDADARLIINASASARS